MNYWSMPIQKQSRHGGPLLPLGTFIFETDEEIFPDLAPFIGALDENLDVLHYTSPVAPVKDLPIDLLHAMEPFLVCERMTVWKVDWAN